jgi:hypothetical protein
LLEVECSILQLVSQLIAPHDRRLSGINVGRSAQIV